MCMSDECCKYAAKVYNEMVEQAHTRAMNYYGAERVEMFLRNCAGGKFQVSTLAERLDVSGDDVYAVINGYRLSNDSDWRNEDDETEVYYFFSANDFNVYDPIGDLIEDENTQLHAKVEELREIIAESDDDHTETLQQLERAYNYIHSALQVIDGATLDSSTAVTVYTVRALLIAAVVGGANAQAVPA